MNTTVDLAPSTAERLDEIEAAIGALASSLTHLGSAVVVVIKSDPLLYRAVTAHRERQQAERKRLVEEQRRERAEAAQVAQKWL